LVVFDATIRRLAGMAMLYVQPIASVDRQRDTLVIRAINPMEEFASSHDVNSIIDSFLALAIEVAHDNDLAAVALPGGDTHLLSNVNAVEQALIERRSYSSSSAYTSLSSSAREGILNPLKSMQAQFDGYARGRHVVNSVYMLWRRPERTLGQP
jgi:hypothetical protein